MPGIREALLALFKIKPHEWADYVAKDAADVSETGNDCHIHILLQPEEIPKEESIRTLLKQIEDRDSCKLIFENSIQEGTEGSLLIMRSAPDVEKYNRFKELFSSGDDIRVSLDIEKTISKDGICSVYEWDAFAEFLLRKSEDKNSPGYLPDYLNSLFEKHPEGVNFRVLDKEADFSTGSISFVHRTEDLTCIEDRSKALKRYNDASLYMGRTENRLLPGDFHANATRSSLPGRSGQDVMDLFGRYETVFSLLYLADASWFEEGNLVIQLVKGGMEFKFPIIEIENNPDIYKLAMWAFESRSALERASIARDVMAFYCRDEAGIMKIGPGILAAAKSNYKLYKRKNIDKYINLKKGLSDSILGSVKQVQDLLGSLIGSFEKNFVAVITVIISEVLAKHVSWKDFSSGQFRTEDFLTVVRIFTFASLIYLVASVISIYFKWKFYANQYELLRSQYKELLPGEELDKAFDNDSLILSARKRLQKFVIIISVLWIVLNLFVLFKSEIASPIIWPYVLVFAAGAALIGFTLFFFRESKKTVQKTDS